MTINELNIVYCVDYKYIKAFFASVYSLFVSNNQFNFVIYVLVPEIDYQKFNDFLMKINIDTIKIITFDPNNYSFLKNIKLVDNDQHLLSYGNLIRLFIQDIINIDSCIYIDADTIFKKDLSEIINQIQDNDICIGFKSETKFNIILKEPIIKNYYDIDLNKNIIYTGFYYINLKYLREINFDYKLHKLLNLHNLYPDGIFTCFTMSIINILLSNQIKFFDENYFTYLADMGWKIYDDKIDFNDFSLLDWSGTRKPWLDHGLYKNIWNEYNIYDYYQSDKFILVISQSLNQIGGSQKYINNLINSYNDNFVCFYDYDQEFKTSYTKYKLDKNDLSNLFGFVKINKNKIKSIIFNNIIWIFNNYQLDFFNSLQIQKIAMIYNEYSSTISYLDKIFVDVVITTSKSIKNKIKNIFPDQKISIIEPVYPKKISNLYPKKFNKKLGFVGRCCMYKGIDLLIQIMRNLITKDNNYTLDIMCPFNLFENLEFREKIKKTINFYKIDKFISLKFVSNHDELLEYCKSNIDILIMPSISEGFPLLLYESLHMNCPIISTDVGDIPKFIEKTGSGKIVNIKKYYQDVDDLYLTTFQKLKEIIDENDDTIIEDFVNQILTIDKKEYNKLQLNIHNFDYQQVLNKYDKKIKKLFTTVI